MEKMVKPEIRKGESIKPDKSNLIFTFDPGNHTGFILVDTKKCSVVCQDILIGYPSITEYLKLALKNKENCTVVYENITGGIGTPEQTRMAKYVGYIEGYCDANGIYKKRQTPGFRKTFIPDAEKYMKKHYVKNAYEVHNVDALAHAMAYIEFELGLKPKWGI